MANPTHRHSRTRRGKRRSHDALQAPATSICPQCNEPKAPHRACLKCGTYKGKEVIPIAE
jgi:large subunit ribosomal protein L32